MAARNQSEHARPGDILLVIRKSDTPPLDPNLAAAVDTNTILHLSFFTSTPHALPFLVPANTDEMILLPAPPTS